MPRKQRKEAAHVDVEAPDSEAGAGQGSSRSFWSGTLSFGLVTVPVDLYSANRTVRRSMRMLASDGTPLARRYFQAGTEKPLESEQIERGYQLEDGSFIQVSDEELEALAPEQSRDIDLTRFVPRDSIAPLYFERSYFMVPSGSTLAYRLLAETMEKTKKAGIATFVMRGKQYVVAIMAEDGILRAETMRFQDELRSAADIGLPAPAQVDKASVKRVRSEIKQLTKPTLSTKELQDEYWQRLSELVEQKRKKQEDVVTPEAEAEAEAQQASNVIDLVAVLKRSLGAAAKAAADEPKAAAPRAKKAATKKSTTSKPKGPGPRRATDRPRKRAAS